LKKIYYKSLAVGNLIKFLIDEKIEKSGLIIGRPIGRPGSHLFEDKWGSGFYLDENDENLTLALPILYRYQRYNIHITSIILLDDISE
jgi:hypothetical protein